MLLLLQCWSILAAWSVMYAGYLRKAARYGMKMCATSSFGAGNNSEEPVSWYTDNALSYAFMAA
jgi:hypothetical protein